MQRHTLVVLSVLALLICYASTIRGMVGVWLVDEDMGHGFLVPLVIAWILWRERATWVHLPIRPSPLGLLFLLAGASLHFISVVGVGLFVASLGLVMSITGTILCLGGFPWLRAWAFPLLLTLFMLPKLAIVYNQATLPLQLFATQLAGGMLSLAGFAVSREGNILSVAGHRISVVEACDGIRYLLPLAFVAVTFAYAADSKRWMRVALLAVALPVALLANAFRVALSAGIPALSVGAAHAVCGWLVFVLCLPLIILSRQIFNSVHSRLYA